MGKRATKRQIRERRKAKQKRRDMYSNDVAAYDFGEAEKRVLAAMDQNQGFKTGEDLYGGLPIGSPERNAAKALRLRQLYSTPLSAGRSGTLTGRLRGD